MQANIGLRTNLGLRGAYAGQRPATRTQLQASQAGIECILAKKTLRNVPYRGYSEMGKSKSNCIIF